MSNRGPSRFLLRIDVLLIWLMAFVLMIPTFDESNNFIKTNFFYFFFLFEVCYFGKHKCFGKSSLISLEICCTKFWFSKLINSLLYFVFCYILQNIQMTLKRQIFHGSSQLDVERNLTMTKRLTFSITFTWGITTIWTWSRMLYFTTIATFIKKLTIFKNRINL